MNLGVGSSSPGERPETDGRSDTSVVTQFFLLPLAVVGGLVGVFLLFSLATRHPPGPRDHLRILQTGRFNQRWQAAFDLSTLLRDRQGSRGDPALVQDLARVFQESRANSDPDARIRRYIALALGYTGSKEAIPALLDGALDPDGETRLYSLWGLAHLAAAEADPVFRRGLGDPDPSVRTVSAYGLGTLSGERIPGELRSALQDPVEEVRWNAALALGRRGDPAGKEILVSLLDRSYLERFASLTPADRTATILNSLRALKYLKTNDMNDKVQELARSDPDPKVREAARGWAHPVAP